MLVLLIDDDLDTHDVLLPYLRSRGFEVWSAHNGVAGLEMFRQHSPDLVILDIQLPRMDGWQVCSQIRETSSVPILMISAVAMEDQDIIRGLGLGADDYITKPLRLEVFHARIEAILRRSAQPDRRGIQQSYSDPRLTLDVARRLVLIEGKQVRLSRLEYQLLELLVSNAGHTVPLTEIVETLWSETASDGDYAVYVRAYIRRLREIIEPDSTDPVYIVNEYGLGYRFERHA